MIWKFETGQIAGENLKDYVEKFDKIIWMHEFIIQSSRKFIEPYLAIIETKTLKLNVKWALLEY